MVKGVLELQTGKDGLTMTILGGMHGDELAGITLVKKLMENPPKILNGRLCLGLGNLEAIKQNRRFIDADLNRSFGVAGAFGYEGERATELKEILMKTDILIDLHSTIRPSKPFICYPGTSINDTSSIVDYLPFDTVVYGKGLWPEDGDHKYADTYVCSKGGLGVTVEAGQLSDVDSVGELEKSIRQVISIYLGENRSALHPSEKVYLKAYKNVIAEKGFSFIKEWGNFEDLEKGQIYATINGKPVIAERKGKILFAKLSHSLVVGDEACLLLEEIEE